MATDPDIFAYTDFHAFLKDWLAVPPRSFGFLQRRCGLSKPHLSNIVSGARRLTSTAAEKLAEGLRLDIHETRYFLALVAVEEGDTERQREEARRVVQGMARFNKATRIERDSLALVSAWYMPVVCELARLPGFQLDPAWVASRIRPEITETQAEEALEVLTRLGVLVPREDGRVDVAMEQYATAHQVDDWTSAAVRESTRQWLRRGEDSLRLSQEVRQLGTLTVAVDPERLEEFRTEVQRFQQRILGMESPVRTERDVIYHLGVQFFPVSEPDQSTET